MARASRRQLALSPKGLPDKLSVLTEAPSLGHRVARPEGRAAHPLTRRRCAPHSQRATVISAAGLEPEPEAGHSIEWAASKGTLLLQTNIALPPSARALPDQCPSERARTRGSWVGTRRLFRRWDL